MSLSCHIKIKDMNIRGSNKTVWEHILNSRQQETTILSLLYTWNFVPQQCLTLLYYYMHPFI